MIPFAPQVVIQTFPEDYLRHDPATINCGNCMRWAYVCYRLFDRIQLWTFGCHAFVQHDGLFYDSERLEGVKSWRDLPATRVPYSNCGCKYCVSALPCTLQEFQTFWDATYHRPDW